MRYTLYSLLQHFGLGEWAIWHVLPPDEQGHRRSLHISNTGAWNVSLQTPRNRSVPLTPGERDRPPYYLLFWELPPGQLATYAAPSPVEQPDVIERSSGTESQQLGEPGYPTRLPKFGPSGRPGLQFWGQDKVSTLHANVLRDHSHKVAHHFPRSGSSNQA